MSSSLSLNPSALSPVGKKASLSLNDSSSPASTSPSPTGSPQLSLNIAIVGLSGSESIKGVEGVGKSCLCSRFTSTREDEYRSNHISYISTSDWHSPAINQCHWLYWGSTSKKASNTELTFTLIEQTEFLNDETLHTFDESDLSPYHKRCTTLKLHSPFKTVYRGKEQLGRHGDHTERLSSTDCIQIDGFVVVVDVSAVARRDFSRQLTEITHILSSIGKSRKPAIIVTTKNDITENVRREYIIEIEKIVSRKEWSKFVHQSLIETSAKLNINVDAAFMILAQMINKSLVKKNGDWPRSALGFTDALKSHEAKRVQLHAFFTQLLSKHVNCYRVKYEQLYSECRHDIQALIEIFGINYVLDEYHKHVERLKSEFISAKKLEIIRRLDRIMEIFYVSPSEKMFYLTNSWDVVMEHMKRHRLFYNHIIVSSPSRVPWYENDAAFFGDNSKMSMPYEIFSSLDCQLYFDEMCKRIKEERKKAECREALMSLLRANAMQYFIVPGNYWSEVSVLVMGRECYECLSEAERLAVYEAFQRSLIIRAKHEYRECLLENAAFINEILVSSQPSVAHVDEILKRLSADKRHLAWERLPQERRGLVLKHLAFLMGKSHKKCDAGSVCVDLVMAQVLKEKMRMKRAPNLVADVVRSLKNISLSQQKDNLPFNLVFIGCAKIASFIIRELKDSVDVNFELKAMIVACDDDFNEYQRVEANFMPNGIVCISDNNNDEKMQQINSLYKKISAKGSAHTISMVYNAAAAAKVSSPSSTSSPTSKEERKSSSTTPSPLSSTSTSSPLARINQSLAHLIQVSSVQELKNVLNEHRSKKINLSQIECDASEYNDYLTYLSSFRLSGDTQKQACGNTSASTTTRIASRVNLCFGIMCQSDYSLIELLLAPLLTHNFYHNSNTNPFAIQFEAFMPSNDCDERRIISVKFMSYHAILQLLQNDRQRQFDGFILSYSLKRLASFECSKSIARLLKSRCEEPICIVAASDENAGNLLCDEQSQTLISSGNTLADELGAKLILATSEFANQSAAFEPFFGQCFEAKIKSGKEVRIEIEMDEPHLYETLPEIEIVNECNEQQSRSRSTSAENILDTPASAGAKSHQLKSSASSSNISSTYNPSSTKLTIVNMTNSTGGESIDASNSSLSSSQRLNSTPSPLPTKPSPLVFSKAYHGFDNDDSVFSSPKVKSNAPLAKAESIDIENQSTLNQYLSANGASLNNTLREVTPTSTPANSTEERSQKSDTEPETPLSSSSSKSRQNSELITNLQISSPILIPNFNNSETPNKPSKSKKARSYLFARKEPLNTHYEAEDATTPLKPTSKKAKRKYARTDKLDIKYGDNKQLYEDPPSTFSCDISFSNQRNYDDEDLITKPKRGFVEKVTNKLKMMKPHSSNSNNNNNNTPSTLSHIVLNPTNPQVFNQNTNIINKLTIDTIYDQNSSSIRMLDSSDGIKTSKNSQQTPSADFTTPSLLSNASKRIQNDFIRLEDELSPTSGIPTIVEKCINYIEEFGLEAEGIYRVPGHKQFTDSLFDDLINRKDSVDLKAYNSSQINVNIVATVIKEYFRRLREPIFGQNTQEYIDIGKLFFSHSASQSLSNSLLVPTKSFDLSAGGSSSSSNSAGGSKKISKKMIGSPNVSVAIQADANSSPGNLMCMPRESSASDVGECSRVSKSNSSLHVTDANHELIAALKAKFGKLNRCNYLTLKAIFAHLNLVACNSAKNQMDSNNLAICWWPTLLRPVLKDIHEYKTSTNYLQPLIKFIIDNTHFIYE